MEIVISSGLLGAIIGVLVWERYRERREWRKVQSDLLDRIMSSDYQQYSAIRINTQEALRKAGAKVEVVRVEELEEKLREGAVVI